MDMLRITNLTKRFGKKEVLRGLSLSVPENSIYGFIGKNGAGKTTTMRTVLGLLAADGGEIMVNGEKVTYGATATNKYIGYLPDVPSFYSFMTAPEYLAFCGGISGLDNQECKKRSAELLELVGLAGETHRIQGYSRGMKQRLGIAQALLGNPKLLICDEPTSALDAVGRKELLDILPTLKERTTVLFSTHILSDVERICTDVAFLDNGVIRMQGKLSDIKKSFCSDDYVLETKHSGDTIAISSAFPEVKIVSDNKLVFSDINDLSFKVLRFVADHNIHVLRFERSEPSLEKMFMEVIDK